MPQEQWEKEFDKDFCEMLPYRDTDLLCWKGIKEDNINLIPTARTVKEWIKETVSSTRTEERKRIVKIAKSMKSEHPTIDRNQTIDDLLSALQEEK